jgi:hypothetical protein
MIGTTNMAKQFDAKVSGLWKDPFASAPPWYKQKRNITVFAKNREEAKDAVLKAAKTHYFVNVTIDHMTELK